MLVILDIGGVLEITPETGWVQRWEERLELPLGTVNERMRDVWRAGSVGRISEHDVHWEVASRLGLDVHQLEAFMADLWAEYLGTPNEELIAYVRGLRGQCRLGILSNSFVGARERETVLYHFDELVEQIVYSHETVSRSRTHVPSKLLAPAWMCSRRAVSSWKMSQPTLRPPRQRA